MAENAKNVFVAAPKAGGAIWSASLGTPLPKNAIDPLDPAFNSLGFISEDGIVNAEESDSEDIKAYGGRVVKTVQTSHKETFTFTPIETNKYVLAERYGSDNVTLDERGNIAVAHNAKSKPARCYVIETVLDDGKIARDVIPAGRVTSVGEKTYKDGAAIAGELTLSCEEDNLGNTAYTYYCLAVDEQPSTPGPDENVSGGDGDVS